MSRVTYIFVTMLFLIGKCSSPGRLEMPQDSKGIGSHVNDTYKSDFSKPELQRLLEQEHRIKKLFAWRSYGGDRKVGTVIGIDAEGKLQRLNFTETLEGYVIKPSELPHEYNEPIAKSGDLELRDYLTDAEFPFKSVILSKEECKIHIIMLWQSFSRSFNQPTIFLNAISVRIIVVKNNQILSNKLQGPFGLKLKEALVDDVNNDGKQDFLLITSDMSTDIHIWSTEQGCTVIPLQFKDEEKLFSSVGDKEAYVVKTNKNSSYEIHVKQYEPLTRGTKVYYEVLEKVYTWDKKDSVFKITRKSTAFIN